MSGEIDCMLKVQLRDLDDCRGLHNRPAKNFDLMDVPASFAFGTMKETTAVPID